MVFAILVNRKTPLSLGIVNEWKPVLKFERIRVKDQQKGTIDCVNIFRIWSYSGLHFPAFGLDTKRYPVSLRIQSDCGKMRTRITPNTDTFHIVIFSKFT